MEGAAYRETQSLGALTEFLEPHHAGMIPPPMQRIFINGAWIDASTPSSTAIDNPATGKPLGRVADCGAADVGLAADAARAALAAWSRSRADDRAALLSAIAQRVRARSRGLAQGLMREAGKPFCEAADCVEGAARIFERAAAARGTNPSGGAREPDGPGGPASVVAAIASCRLPLLELALTVAPALAMGHTVVLKPARRTSLSSLELVDACGVLPPGVVNVVTGGEETGWALLAHAEVGRVRFSGSPEGGRRVADRGKPVERLIMARSAFIVCKEADLERAVPAIAWERLTNTGQSRGSPRHIYVDRAIAAELSERMHQYVGFLDVDDPEKLPTDLGPLISLDAAKRVEDQVGRTLRAGARLILGGRRFRPSGLAGHFFQPTLLTDVPPGSVPTVEDIAGPVVTLTPVAGLSEALRLVSESGCEGASVYGSRDIVLGEIKPETRGTFRINDPEERAEEGAAPLGIPAGMRALAGGTGSRIEAAEAVSIKPWWFPYLERNRLNR
jgi:acyl-CoA reductase-like NAD-dependent aldehyde dehydrogenase